MAAYETKIFSIQARAGANCILPTKLEVLFGGLSRRSNSDHGPSAIDPLHRSACPFPGIDKMAMFGPISIDLAYDEVPAWEVQYSYWRSKLEPKPSCQGFK